MLTRKNYVSTLAEEPKSLSFWRDAFAECLGTFLLVSVQAALPLSWGDDKLGNVVQVALGMGFIVCGLAWVLGDFGGGHFNPAVTCAMAVAVKITILRAAIYIVFQCLGGVAGAALIYGLTPEINREGLASTTLHPNVTPVQGCAIECWITFILVLVIMGSTNSARKQQLFMPNIPIGFAVALGIMSAFGSTGGSMNPARTLGPAVMMGIWSNHWVYWVGPCLGGCIASLVYTLLLDRVGKSVPVADKKEHVESNGVDTKF